VKDAIETLKHPTASALTDLDAAPSPAHLFAYRAISHLWSSVKTAHKEIICSNVLVASMFIKYLMQGNLDLPNTLSDFYATICGDASCVPPSWGKENKIIQRLRLPLQLALAVSPLCLLLPVRLALKDVGRDKLMNVCLLLLFFLISPTPSP
jgi:hypothetical protein